MLKQRGGAIVIVVAKAAIARAAGAAAFAASKAGALAMMHVGCGGKAHRGAGCIDTEANRKATSSADFAKWLENLGRRACQPFSVQRRGQNGFMVQPYRYTGIGDC